MTRGVFFFGSPYSVGRYLVVKSIDGSYLVNLGVTLLETTAGFVIGNLVGSFLGLSFWYSPRLSQVSRPYIVALGSIPIFAVSPIVIIWFGIGLPSKIALAAISTMVVATVHAFEGASQTDPRLLELLHSMRASKFTAFRKVVVPSAITWLFAGYRMNVAFALLGAFIGEFISAEAGLGHMIIQAMGLFNIPLVLAGVVGLCVISFVLTSMVNLAQKWLIPWKVRRRIEKCRPAA
ncbi:MAG: ABC transporter permease subunit [Nitrospiraceae bacterium]|nr:ABC transporter permease subunit [Nitrospiraceae bacterium]